MFETIIKFISEFMHGSRDQVILVILIFLISLFFLITIFLFLITIYLRIKNNLKAFRIVIMSKNWDPIILSVMDDSINPYEAFKKLKWRNSIDYLLYLELYIDMVKGKEKERLLVLGKMSLKKLHNLLLSRSRKKKLYGVHLLGIFHPEDQYKYLKFDSKDILLSLTMIREMRTIDNFRVKERLINLLFLFRYVSPIYISNILVDMGPDIIPILKMLILERKEHPYEQIIAIETLRRMHYSGCQELAGKLFHNIDHPVVLTSFLRYLEEMGDETQIEKIKPYLSHPGTQVRLAAVKAFIALSPQVNVNEIKQFFNDPSVNIAVSAAEKMKISGAIPYIELSEIEKFKWANIYKRMVY